MTEPENAQVEVKVKAPKSAKRQKGDLIKQVREVSNPDRFRIPKKHPMWNPRWIRNTEDNISLMEAKGYQVASADQVRAMGLKPSVDGTCRKGDLVLAIEDMAHHKAHKDAEAELRRRQQGSMRQGLRRPAQAGGFQFEETAKSSQ